MYRTEWNNSVFRIRLIGRLHYKRPVTRARLSWPIRKVIDNMATAVASCPKVHRRAYQSLTASWLDIGPPDFTTRQVVIVWQFTKHLFCLAVSPIWLMKRAANALRWFIIISLAIMTGVERAGVETRRSRISKTCPPGLFVQAIFSSPGTFHRFPAHGQRPNVRL